MAEILENYDFRGQGRPNIYPFDEWFDGQVWKVYQGVDFNCTLTSMRVTLRSAAKKRGIKMQTSIRADAVIFQTLGEKHDEL